ncbi:MAG: hypothetical protein MI757_08290 [Pirellulales bacterium]|nr:hypothetical protein [Pirellulales bacterium]
MATGTYLNELLRPVDDAFTVEGARRIVNVQAGPELQARIDQLREGANTGTLTPDEDAEYKEFVDALDVLSIIQSKARRFLSTHVQ